MRDLFIPASGDLEGTLPEPAGNPITVFFVPPCTTDIQPVQITGGHMDDKLNKDSCGEQDRGERALYGCRL